MQSNYFLHGNVRDVLFDTYRQHGVKAGHAALLNANNTLTLEQLMRAKPYLSEACELVHDFVLRTVPIRDLWPALLALHFRNRGGDHSVAALEHALLALLDSNETAEDP